MTVRSDQRDILLVETLSIDIEIGFERHGIAGVQRPKLRFLVSSSYVLVSNMENSGLLWEGNR
jgi:hypothetical protein